MDALDTFKIDKRENIHIIGIAGGIASGKTTVAESFAECGAYIINADKIVHEILQEKDVQKKIAQAFPLIFLDGVFQKQILAKEVFSSQEKLKILESILHPVVRNRIKERLQCLANDHGKKIVVLDAALLWENGLYKGVDTLIFVDTPLDLRRRRAQENRNWDEKEVDRRESFQIDLATKKEGSKYTIVNNDESLMKQQVHNIWDTINSFLINRK